MLTLIGITTILLIVVWALHYLPVWLMCMLAGCQVSLFDILRTGFRRRNPGMIASALIRLHKADVQIAFHDIERHAIDGGNVLRTAAATIEAKTHNLGLTWEELCAMDLADQNPIDAVNDIIGETPNA